MNTETQTAHADQSVATTGGDEFTAEERAYFESRGEKGLPGDAAAADPAPKATTEKPVASATDGDDPEGTISIDENGAHRDKRTGRFVPHGAFHKEREGRKAAETRASEQAIELARTKERLDILAKALEGGDVTKPAQASTAQGQDDDPEPDIEKDFVAHAKWQARELARLRKSLTESQSSLSAKLTETEMGNAYRSDAIAFMREKADFRDAYNHLVKVLDAELAHRGVDDPAKRLAEIARLEREEVAFATKRGLRPAEHIYKLAGLRGWTPPKTDAAAASAQPSGEQKAANSAAADELTRLEKGQNAARSLSSAGGSAPAPLTGEAIASMSDAEFDALLRKSGPNPNAALRKLLGG